MVFMNAPARISQYIDSLTDWRGKVLGRIRRLIAEASPELVEEWKWSTPVWTCNGNVVAVGSFQDHVKVNFFEGASLNDPGKLFNAGLEAKASRAIDLGKGDRLDEAAFKALVKAAVALKNVRRKT
jgi:hypothetical protein